MQIGIHQKTNRIRQRKVTNIRKISKQNWKNLGENGHGHFGETEI